MNLHEEENKKRAAILRFSRKRGRPKTFRPSTDTGTPEMVMKRLLGETSEALDLCLERDIITRDQHWCGIHLRWLYTLRHGAPSVRAIDITHTGGIEPKLDDPEWRQAREKEYLHALKKLSDSGYALLIVNLCIYNERPAFLRRNSLTEKKPHAVTPDIRRICEGLDILVEGWVKPSQSRK